jgi:multiple sugar transport system ATP-binding protein
MTLGDRIVIMKDGFIKQVGTPTEVFDKPANLFVAEFIGAPKMNIFNAKLIKENGEYYVSGFGAKILVDGEKGEILKSKHVLNQDIILGARPEHMILKAEAGEDTLKCKVLVNEMMGSELHLHVETESGEKIIVRVPTINLSEAQKNSLTFGSTIYVSFEGKVMHFFNTETQESLLA